MFVLNYGYKLNKQYFIDQNWPANNRTYIKASMYHISYPDFALQY